jgi:hypothetical protein
MVKLLQPIQLEIENSIAHVTLWLCEPFGIHYSFRSTLSQIEQTLAKSAPTHLALPPAEPDEDFVEGHLAWGGRKFTLYFEHALGYLEFSSSSLADVQALQAAL